MARLFITGICGFIGKSIAKKALAMGYDVSGADIRIIKIPGARIFKADIRNRKAMLKLTKNVDYVIHLAAVTSNIEFERRLPYSYGVNVDGFNSVIEAAATNGCKRFVYASSAAVYLKDFNENALIDIRKQHSHYAKTKLVNEMVASSYSEAGLLETVGLRLFNVYGHGENLKGDYASIISRFIRCKREGEPLLIYGDGEQARDFISISDVAIITLRLLKKCKHRIYNVGIGNATSFEKIADMVDKNNKKYTKNMLSSYQYFTRADTRRLLGDLGGFKFKSVKEGVAELLYLDEKAE